MSIEVKPQKPWQMTPREMVYPTFLILISAMALGHIYIGSIGMQGSIDGMKTGYVDATWAKEHHELWYNKVSK